MTKTQRIQRRLAIIHRFHPEVVEVKDAERSIYVEVDGRFVRGASAKPDQCPLARACMNEMQLDGALISRGVCYTIRNGVAERYVPSGITRTMLRNFDKTGKFPVGIYMLSVPPPSQTLDARQKRPQGPGNSRTVRRPKMKRTYLVKGERSRLNVAGLR